MVTEKEVWEWLREGYKPKVYRRRGQVVEIALYLYDGDGTLHSGFAFELPFGGRVGEWPSTGHTREELEAMAVVVERAARKAGVGA
jgi:hypothetical protein